MAPRPFTLDLLGMRPPPQRRRPPFFDTKKLAIVGMTPTHVFTPWHDPTWTIAAHPCTYTIVEREPDWWFDLHPSACFTKAKGWRAGYYNWLKHLRTPIFMQHDWPEIPMATRFPRERIMAEYRAYFSNHAAWMVALALTEGVTHVGIYGCEYSSDPERGIQRGSLEYWLGVFEGRGGHVILPPGSRLLNKPAELYGYESHDLKTGKLIDSYRYCQKAQAPTHGEPPQTLLYPVDPKTGEHRQPLMKIPDIEPAWERSGHLIHA